MIGDQKCSLSRLEPSNRHNFMNINEKNMKNNDTANLYHFFLWIHYSIYISQITFSFLTKLLFVMLKEGFPGWE